MVRWHSLYLSPDNTVEIADALQPLLTAAGYTQYEPFVLGAPAYEQAVRLFCAPTDHGWRRILLEITHFTLVDDIASALAPSGVCISAWMSSDEDGGLSVYQRGQRTTLDVLYDYQTDSPTLPDLPEQKTIGNVPIDQMPEHIQKLAGKVKSRQAENMFNKMTRRILHSEDKQAASELVNSQPNWQSETGQQIATVLSSLGLANWHQPDFATLRNAYGLHLRRQRNPNALLLPGDEEAMQAVPDALEYVPYYWGKEA
ncbi:MAG: hypothetical protein KC546_05850 [Anaerolineae bacterium]|nr:hypothetical protein [Anaerolineae bacterium]